MGRKAEVSLYRLFNVKGMQEQKSRQHAIDASTQPVVPTVPPRKTLLEHISQFAAKKDGLTKTERRRANAWRSFLKDFSKWWGQEHIDDLSAGTLRRLS
jgi:hypothetical protein